jgi:hypothetical protein
VTLTPLAHLPGHARIANGAIEHVTALAFRRFHRRLNRVPEDGTP